jgi:pyruvate formate lyase activating enzyme
MATPAFSAPLEAKNEFELRKGLGARVAENEQRAALTSGDLGFLHSFTTGSTLDGPGVRLVAWTTGCMFRCAFCHNPDTWTLTNGMPVTVERATEEIRKYAHGLRTMNGGFTLSGGEPLAQHRFAVKLFRAAKSMQIHTAIETNGYNGHRLSDSELEEIDLVILDVKGFSAAQHARVTSVEQNSPVLAFARRLASLKRPMWLRYVLVPGLTDVPDEIRSVAAFGASLGVVERVEVLPFHQLGRFKWRNLGLDYTLDETEPPSAKSVASAIAMFRREGLEAS